MQIYPRIVRGCGVINLDGSFKQNIEKDTIKRAIEAYIVKFIAT